MHRHLFHPGYHLFRDNRRPLAAQEGRARPDNERYYLGQRYSSRIKNTLRAYSSKRYRRSKARDPSHLLPFGPFGSCVTAKSRFSSRPCRPFDPRITFVPDIARRSNYFFVWHYQSPPFSLGSLRARDSWPPAIPFQSSRSDDTSFTLHPFESTWPGQSWIPWRAGISIQSRITLFTLRSRFHCFEIIFFRL